MKVTTFNVNNVNKRLPLLVAWLKTAKPDIVCLQELKCEPSAFPDAALRRAGYASVWEGERSWNGVAILARKTEPVVTRRKLPGDPQDRQARYIEAAVGGMIVACLYLPNGNPQPGPKFTYKMQWFARLARHAAALQRKRVPVILAGDYNVVPAAIDIYPTTSWDKDALVQPKPREAFARLLDKGWTDALRHVSGEKRIYTFWTYWRERYEKDHGLRIDHLLLTKDLTARLSGAGVDHKVRGFDGASDHAPVWITLD